MFFVALWQQIDFSFYRISFSSMIGLFSLCVDSQADRRQAVENNKIAMDNKIEIR